MRSANQAYESMPLTMCSPNYNLGVYSSPTECFNNGVPTNANCDGVRIMWSVYSTYSSAWGCRCCGSGATTGSHSIWCDAQPHRHAHGPATHATNPHCPFFPSRDIYEMPNRRRLQEAEEDLADLPALPAPSTLGGGTRRTLLYGTAAVDQLLDELVHAVGTRELQDEYDP